MSSQKVTYGFLPTSITGCALWLDASDTTTISQNSSSSVLQWRDKSGNGLSAVYDSVTGYTLPTYVSNGATKYVSLQSGQGLYIPIFSYNTAWSVFSCMSNVTLGNRWYISPYPDVQVVMMGMYEGTSKIWPALLPNGTTDITGSHIEYTSAQNTNGTGSYLYYRDGSIQSSNNTTNNVASTTVRLGIGGNGGSSNDVGGTYYPFEIIIFNQYLGDTDRQTVEGYLAQKWGLTSSLPPGHPGLTKTIYRSDYTKQNIMTAIPYYAAFSPRQISGCALWLDAADASTVTLTTTTAFTETFSNVGVPTTSVYNANGVATGTSYAYLANNAAFSPYLTQANWTWTNGGISYGSSPFAGVSPTSPVSGSLGYSAFIQVNSTPSTLIRTTTIPGGVSCTLSFWYLNRDGSHPPYSLAVTYGTQSVVTINNPYVANSWTNSTTTFITSVANQNLTFTVTLDTSQNYGDQSTNIAYVQVTYANSAVTNVADKSGNGVVLSNATGFTYPNNSFNGKYPSFLCTGGGYGQTNNAATLGYNASFAITTPFTVFFVLHQTETIADGYIMDSQSGSSRQYTYTRTLSSPFGNAGTSVTLSPFIGSQSWIAGTSVLYVNGTSSFSGSLSSFTTGGIIVGNRYSINESWPGHICELIYYSGQLGTTQRQQVESYLAQKWGLTSSLPGGHQHFTQQTGAVTPVANTIFRMLPRIVFASSGLAITHQDGRVWKVSSTAIGLNTGTAMSLTIYAGSDVYNSAGGRVGLFDGGSSANAVRHSGYVMWANAFSANNFDFAWKFVSSGSGYLIYNDYPSTSSWQVSYDSGTDRVLIVAPADGRYGLVWNVTPKVSLAYVYSSY